MSNTSYIVHYNFEQSTYSRDACDLHNFDKEYSFNVLLPNIFSDTFCYKYNKVKGGIEFKNLC